MRTVFGVGINDADYQVQPRVNGKTVVCGYYSVWYSMLRRCYSKVYQKAKPTYIGCSVVPEWLSFMTFRAWMKQQDWEGKQLDKDLLYDGNKIYGPEFCLFISREVNLFLSDRKSTNQNLPVGVQLAKSGKYIASSSDGTRKSQKYLGRFHTAEEASQVYRIYKCWRAIEICSEQSQIVANAILCRYFTEDYLTELKDTSSTKCCILLSPDGVIHEVDNIGKFSLAHGLLSSEVYALTTNSKRKSTRGWRLLKSINTLDSIEEI